MSCARSLGHVWSFTSMWVSGFSSFPVVSAALPRPAASHGTASVVRDESLVSAFYPSFPGHFEKGPLCPCPPVGKGILPTEVAWVPGASMSGPLMPHTSGTPSTSPRRLPVAGASTAVSRSHPWSSISGIWSPYARLSGIAVTRGFSSIGYPLRPPVAKSSACCTREFAGALCYSLAIA
ncbi:Methionine synthase [Trichinella pseudospiralis]